MLLDPIKDEGGGGQAPTRKADFGSATRNRRLNAGLPKQLIETLALRTALQHESLRDRSPTRDIAPQHS